MTKPLRITDRVWERKGNNLEYDRIVKRFDELQELYAQAVNHVRRNWDSDTSLVEVPALPELMAEFSEFKIDAVLVGMKSRNNINFAIRRNNKYLLSEDMTQFPIMNYDLKEGPYCPPDDAVFGPEDKHVVIQGDNDLIFFQTEINGLEKGLIVENLL